MKPEQLQQIVKTKNEQRERQAVRSAEDIIEAIVAEQQRIQTAQKRILDLRGELTQLQVEELDATLILGTN